MASYAVKFRKDENLLPDFKKHISNSLLRTPDSELPLKEQRVSFRAELPTPN
jgi:hypothetical protein